MMPCILARSTTLFDTLQTWCASVVRDSFHVAEELHVNGNRPDLRICVISGRPELRRVLLDRYSLDFLARVA